MAERSKFLQDTAKGLTERQLGVRTLNWEEAISQENNPDLLPSDKATSYTELVQRHTESLTRQTSS